jgi:hypothetical protein
VAVEEAEVDVVDVVADVDEVGEEVAVVDGEAVATVMQKGAVVERARRRAGRSKRKRVRRGRGRWNLMVDRMLE